MHLISLTPKRSPKKILLFLLGILLVAGGLYYFFAVKGKGTGQALLPDLFMGLTNEPPPPPPKEPNVLNGVPVDPAVANRRPLAIMVENHTDARPQVGLTKAAIIYEAIAEGGITRFMAVFGPFDAEKIGPVRSARQYYVEWAKGMDALYAHVGGSQDTRALIRSIGLADLDQFRWGTQAYWREPKAGVAIEHTMFTSTKKLYEVAKKAKFDLKASITPYKFKEDEKVEARGASQTITIPFSTSAYQVVWTYNQATNTYLRTHGGIEHVDRVTGERVTAKNIVVAIVKRALKPEDQGTGWTMTTTGSGKATVLLDGKSIVGTWKRPAKTDMLRFYDEAGTEIVFNRGQIWIEIVPPEVKVTVQ